MDVKTAICTRRSIKHFDPTHKMSEAEMQELLALAVLSPTAFNIQHWRFVVVTDTELRNEIRACSWMQAQITDASMLIIVCADTQAWCKQPARYWENVDAELREGIVEAIDTYYQGRQTLQRDEAMRSCGIAAQTLMLAAKAMGYESSPMDLSDFDAVAKLINLPPDHVIALFVAIGKGVREARPRAGQLPLAEVILQNRF